MNTVGDLKTALADLVSASRRFQNAIAKDDSRFAFGERKTLDELIGCIVGTDGLSDMRNAIKRISAFLPEGTPTVHRKKIDAIYHAVTRAVALLSSKRLIGPYTYDSKGRCTASRDAMLADGVSRETLDLLDAQDGEKSYSLAWLFAEIIWLREFQGFGRNVNGDLRSAIAKDSEKIATKRKQRARSSFAKRYGIMPADFLKCDDSEMEFVEIVSGRNAGNTLGAARASRVKLHANEIESRGVEEGDLKEALRDKVSERLSAILRS